MLSSIQHLKGSKIAATDGEIGQVEQAYFDDQNWVIRYLVVDAGTWLAGREVLISPYAVTQSPGKGKLVRVSLNRQQVHDSPYIDTHRPVSRQHEREYLRYYAYPEYWGGSGLWALEALPLLPPPLPAAVESEEAARRREADVPAEDVHLRSSAAVTGHDIQAADGSLGHVEDFIFDDASWAIRYLVVDTRNWWPGGQRVLIATRWIDHIDWTDETVHVRLTREQIRNSPKYEAGQPIERDFEQRLHEAHARRGYWD